MTWLLDLIPGGGLTAILAGAVAALGIFWRLLANAKKSGVDQQKAKEAEARAKNLQDVKRAQDAAASVRPDDGGVLNDPNNRDRRV